MKPLATIMNQLHLDKEANEIFFHRLFFRLAIGTITIFLPLYIYNLSGLGAVFLYFFIYFATFAVLSWPVAELTSKLGYKHTALLSSPFIFIYYFILRSLQSPGIGIYFVAVFGGFAFNTYWMAMNSEMTVGSRGDNREKDSAYFFGLPQLASFISPFLGGVILSTFGFETLFLATLFLLLISYVPLFLSREHHEGMEIDKYEIFNSDHLKDWVTFFFWGFSSVGRIVVWPLLLALVITDALNMGGAGSLRALGVFIVSIVSGRIINQENKYKVLLFGSFIFSVTWILMALVTTPLQAFIISFLNGVFSVVYNIPLFAEILEKADRKDVLEYFTFREIILNIGKITSLGMFFLIFTSFALNKAFLIAFTLVAFSVLPVGFFGRKINQN